MQNIHLNTWLYLTDIMDTLDEQGFTPNLVANHKNLTTRHSSKWLYTVTNALTFDFYDDYFDKELFGRCEFELNRIVQDKILKVFEDAWISMKPEMTEVDALRDQLYAIKTRWRNHCYDFEYSMILVRDLAYEVLTYIDYQEEKISGIMVDDEVLKFDDEVIKPLTKALMSEVYDILNHSDYHYELENELQILDVSVLYTMFDQYIYNMTIAEACTESFKKSLRYRVRMDRHGFDCLLKLYEVQFFNFFHDK